MMNDWRRTEPAVRNNARWCHLVCSAHGSPGVFEAHAWHTRGPAPPFYPNMVTLTAHNQAAQLDTIRGLLDGGLAGGWGIKDSFAALDLTPFGFSPLIEAQWVRRAAGLPLPVQPASGARWSRVSDPRVLAQWERAWGSEQQAPLFTPSLLRDPNVHFLAAWQDDEIRAGAVACLTDGVVGLSNLFAPAGEEEAYWAGCLALLAAAYPALDLVDYEHGASLEIVQALGFEPIGPLVIWLAGG